MTFSREGFLKKGTLQQLIRETAADQSKLVSYTDSSCEEEDLHININSDERIDLAIN